MKIALFSQKYQLSQNEKLALVEGLSIMLSAGIPILEALESIEEDASQRQAKEVIRGLSKQLSSGKSLSSAMSTYPATFDSVLISIVRSGEESGKLDQVLADLAENLKSSIETANNIKSALFYPALVIVVLIAVSFYMFIFALPKIAQVFLDLGVHLPAYSSFILRSSLFIHDYSLFVVGIFLLIVLAFVYLFRNAKTRVFLFSFLAKLPPIGSLVKYMDLSRFTNTSSLLLSAGVPIIDALEIAGSVVFSPKLKRDIGFLKDSLVSGANLSDSMKERPTSFPSLLRRVVGVGEETGNLDKSLSDISKHYQKKFTDIVKNLTVLLEPTLLVIIGVVVGAVLLSIVMPIYQLIGQINPQ